MASDQKLERILGDIEALVEEAKSVLSGQEEVVFVHGQGELTPRRVEWLKARTARWPGAYTLFQIAARRPEGIVHYEEAVQQAGIGDQQMRNELAAVSRLTNQEWGAKTRPVESWQSSTTGKMEYRMPRKVAEWWQAT